MIKRLNDQGAISLVIIAVVALLAVGGVGAYVATDGFGTREKSQTNSENTTAETEKEDNAEPIEASGSIALLEGALAGGDAVKCTYDEEGNSGTAYIASENKFRVDYSNAEGSGHLVFNDNTMYIWADNEAQGFKMTNPKESSEELAEEYDDYSPEKLKENYNEENMDCAKFSFDDSLVEVPSNVEFLSFEEMFQQLQN